MGGGKIWIEPDGLSGVPLGAGGGGGGVVEAARLSERDGDGEVGVGGGEVRIECDGAPQGGLLGLMFDGYETPAEGTGAEILLVCARIRRPRLRGIAAFLHAELLIQA